ncbi:MAG: HlyD family efflux transporter periplasmic adaptor subunit [Caulobacterales bacterium]
MTRQISPHRALLGAALLALAGCGAKTPTYTGYVEADYALISAPQSGWITAVNVDRGAVIKNGDALFTLDADLQTAAESEAAQRAAAAQANVRDLQRGARPADLAPLEAQRINAQAQYDLATRDEARWRPLVDKGFASKAKLDEIVAQRESARAQLAQIDKTIAAEKLSARSDQLAAARANSAAANSVVAQAAWTKGQRSIESRIAGAVEDRLREPGEFVAAGQPVLSVLPEGRTFVRFFVPQEDIAGLRVGDVLNLSCDGCADGMQARIRFISREAEFTPPVIFSERERQRLVFMVEAAPEGGDVILRPGLPVDVRAAALKSKGKERHG